MGIVVENTGQTTLLKFAAAAVKQRFLMDGSPAKERLPAPSRLTFRF